MNFYIKQHCPKGWEDFFLNNNTLQFVEQKLEHVQCIPRVEKIFSTFYYCKPEDIKVIILGQDPYPNAAHACGLSFSTGCSKISPPLANIYKTMEGKVPGFIKPDHGDLSWWAAQGVFMINKVLTIPLGGKSGEHVDIWANFIRQLIGFIVAKQQNIVWMLWGRKIQEVEKMFNAREHLILKCNSPSPPSYNRNEDSPQNFRHMNHFNEANVYLMKNRKTFINWCFPGFFNHRDNILCYDIETSGFLINAKDEDIEKGNYKQLSQMVAPKTKKRGAKPTPRLVKTKGQNYITSIAWTFNGQMKRACYRFGKYPIYDQLETFDDFVEDMKKAKMVITYNGKGFDEPFIESMLDVPPHDFHFDLKDVTHCKLKTLAKVWGLDRSSGQVDGAVAVRLWKRWTREQDESALKTMIDYNIDDTFETYKIWCLENGIKCLPINIRKLQ